MSSPSVENPPLFDHTDEIVAGRRITGFAGRQISRDNRIGKPLWNWVCMPCGEAGDSPAKWENLRQLDRLGVENCKHCSMGRRKNVPLGTRCQNLVSIGPCRLSRNQTGSLKRELPCRCEICGAEGWWQKTDFLAGKANCNCHRKVQGGLSNTRVGILWSGARRRADERGIPFTIEHEDIVIPEFCPVLGIRLSHANSEQQTRKGEGVSMLPARHWID